MSSGKEIQLLIRSDDLGYSEAVNYGIAKVLEYGMTKSIGLMPNMPSAVHGIKLIQNYHTCIGQHTNICVGKPVTDPALIPSLVNQNGDFKSSSVYRGSSEDFVNLDEVIMEIKAQLNGPDRIPNILKDMLYVAKISSEVFRLLPRNII